MPCHLHARVLDDDEDVDKCNYYYFTSYTNFSGVFYWTMHVVFML